MRSCDELADTTGSSDALLGNLGEHLGAHNAGHVGELALAKDLDEALKTKQSTVRPLLINKKETYSFGSIDHSSLLLGGGFACFLGHESPELVKVHRWAVVLVFLIVEMSLSLLSEVAWMTAYNETIIVSQLLLLEGREKRAVRAKRQACITLIASILTI